MLQGFVPAVVGAAQVLGDMHQGVVGRDVGVYGEQWGMAGVAAAEGALCGVGEGWIRNNLFHCSKLSRLYCNHPFPREGWQLYAGWKTGERQPGRPYGLPRTTAIEDSTSDRDGFPHPIAEPTATRLA